MPSDRPWYCLMVSGEYSLGISKYGFTAISMLATNVCNTKQHEQQESTQLMHLNFLEDNHFQFFFFFFLINKKWQVHYYLQRVSVFGCVVSICSVFLYWVVLRVFAASFCIWLCCEYLQHFSIFGCIASIWLCCEYLVVLRVFAACFCIGLCCEYLQQVSVFG